jgi:hypothetical protein
MLLHNLQKSMILILKKKVVLVDIEEYDYKFLRRQQRITQIISYFIFY